MSSIITHKSIIVEDRFEELFSYLPEMSNDKASLYKPTFGYGDEVELNNFLTLHKKGSKVYPLIWLVYPYTEVHLRTKVLLQNFSIILAVETNTIMLNKQRLNDIYKEYLYPLFDNIKKILRIANITDTPQKYVVTKYPNYTGVVDSDGNATQDIWDALKITFDISIDNRCLRKIKL